MSEEIKLEGKMAEFVDWIETISVAGRTRRKRRRRGFVHHWPAGARPYPHLRGSAAGRNREREFALAANAPTRFNLGNSERIAFPCVVGAKKLHAASHE